MKITVNTFTTPNLRQNYFSSPCVPKTSKTIRPRCFEEDANQNYDFRCSRGYLVELGISSAGQEAVKLDQQTQVDILALGLRPAGLSHVLVTDIDSHLDVKILIKTTLKIYNLLRMKRNSF